MILGIIHIKIFDLKNSNCKDKSILVKSRNYKNRFLKNDFGNNPYFFFECVNVHKLGRVDCYE